MVRSHSTLTQARQIQSVSWLNKHVKNLLEQQLPLLWIEGEISNFVRAASGHCYFSLKDAHAQVRCAMFRKQSRALLFNAANGVKVWAQVRITLYEPRGDYQLIVESMEEAGLGALHQAYEQLKKKLALQGLFAAEHKKKLPASINHVGVITSPTGAAIKDILTTMQRRFPLTQVTLYPSKVQGKDASSHLCAALSLAQRHKAAEVLIIGRGGGSLEDLWCFNDEQLAHAIHQCTLPVIAAVGHEIDFTICDFVADIRAATPTAAAELVTPAQEDLLLQLQQQLQRMILAVRQQYQFFATHLANLQKRLQHPQQRLQYLAQRLDDREQRLKNAYSLLMGKYRARLTEKVHKLLLLHPRNALQQKKAAVQHLQLQLTSTYKENLLTKKQRLQQVMSTLQAVSPLATLQRGYAIVKDDHNTVVRSAEVLKANDKLSVLLADGSVACSVLPSSTHTTGSDDAQ